MRGMNNQKKRPQKIIESGNKSRLSKLTESLVWVVVGILLTTVFNQWGAAWLPGPHVTSYVSGLRVSKGNAQGCTIYHLDLFTDEPIDSSFVKLVLPQNVKKMQVGHAAEVMTGPSGAVSAQAWVIARNADGQCDIKQSAVNLTDGISFVATANVLTIRTSNIEKGESVMGVAVVDSADSVMNSEDPILDGNYQYTKWGVVIRKKLVFRYFGISNAK